MKNPNSSRPTSLFISRIWSRLCGRIVTTALLLLLAAESLHAQGTLICDEQNQSLSASALFEVRMNGNPKKGVLIPHMTKEDRSGIPQPVREGLLIYQTDGVPGIYCHIGEGGQQWLAIGCGLGSDTDDFNTAFGVNALLSIPGTHVPGLGQANTAVGMDCLRNNALGSYNTGVGDEALYSTNTNVGSHNVGIGAGALKTNIAGDHNTAIGSGADVIGADLHHVTLLGAGTTSNRDYATAIGAGATVTRSHAIALGGETGTTAAVNVGIGTSNPGAKLEIADGAADATGYGSLQITRAASGYNGSHLSFVKSANWVIGLGFKPSTSSQVFGFGNLSFPVGSFDPTLLAIDPTGGGKVGIGYTSPSEKLYVAGNICATGTIGTCSDIRYKKDVTPLSSSLTRILALQGITYHWKSDEFPERNFAKGAQIGLIAQEVERVCPEVVQTGSDGYKSIDYARLTPILIEALKEQQRMIDDARKENTRLASRLSELEATVKSLAEHKNESGLVRKAAFILNQNEK